MYSWMAQKGWPRCLMRVNPQIELRREERGTSSARGRLTLKWTLPGPIAVSFESRKSLDGSLFGSTVVGEESVAIEVAHTAEHSRGAGSGENRRIRSRNE